VGKVETVDEWGQAVVGEVCGRGQSGNVPASCSNVHLKLFYRVLIWRPLFTHVHVTIYFY
jgi:hypothetical protein